MSKCRLSLQRYHYAFHLNLGEDHQTPHEERHTQFSVIVTWTLMRNGFDFCSYCCDSFLLGFTSLLFTPLFEIHSIVMPFSLRFNSRLPLIQAPLNFTSYILCVPLWDAKSGMENTVLRLSILEVIPRCEVSSLAFEERWNSSSLVTSSLPSHVFSSWAGSRE